MAGDTLFDLEDYEGPAQRRITRSQALAVVRWHELGINVLERWRLMYGAEDAPTDARRLLQQARMSVTP